MSDFMVPSDKISHITHKLSVQKKVSSAKKHWSTAVFSQSNLGLFILLLSTGMYFIQTVHLTNLFYAEELAAVNCNCRSPRLQWVKST